ncbi:MAG: hypothetical protein EOM74_05310 [Methanomicrobia archaeon]|nr:hypothetical protein [Methanomicrobia archaeon]
MIDKIGYINVDFKNNKMWASAFTESKNCIKNIRCSADLVFVDIDEDTKSTFGAPVKIGFSNLKKTVLALKQFPNRVDINFKLELTDAVSATPDGQMHFASYLILDDDELKITIPCLDLSMSSIEIPDSSVRALVNHGDTTGISLSKTDIQDIVKLLGYSSDSDYAYIGCDKKNISLSEDEYSKIIASNEDYGFNEFKLRIKKNVFKYIDIDNQIMYIFPEFRQNPVNENISLPPTIVIESDTGNIFTACCFALIDESEFEDTLEQSNYFEEK